MRKMLFFACLLLGLSACEKDPDMNQLDADLVVYTDYDKDADFGGYKTYFLPDSILEAGGHRATYWKDENAKAIINKVAAAQAKASLSFGDAFVRGILCNFLVCIAVWMASAAKSVPGKILAVFFPIMTFVVAGFEHSVADMYYLTAGLLTAAQTGAAAAGLTWSRALLGNLLPVTLGNLVGGVLLVGVSGWYLYLKQGKTTVIS